MRGMAGEASTTTTLPPSPATTAPATTTTAPATTTTAPATTTTAPATATTAPGGTTTAPGSTTTTAGSPQFTLVEVKIDPDDGTEHHDHSVQVAADVKLKLKWETSGAASVSIDGLGDAGFDASGEE